MPGGRPSSLNHNIIGHDTRGLIFPKYNAPVRCRSIIVHYVQTNWRKRVQSLHIDEVWIRNPRSMVVVASGRLWPCRGKHAGAVNIDIPSPIVPGYWIKICVYHWLFMVYRNSECAVLDTCTILISTCGQITALRPQDTTDGICLWKCLGVLRDPGQWASLSNVAWGGSRFQSLDSLEDFRPKPIPN